MSQLDLLYRLQQAESEIREDKKRLTDAIRHQSESVELVKARRRAESTESTLDKLRAVQKELTLNLETLNAKAKRDEDRLYSGLVTNPKELEDLQKEIESLGRRMSVIEEQLLDAMIEVEEAESENDAALEEFDRIETEWRVKAARCKELQEELVVRIKELTAQKNGILPLLHPETVTALEVAQRRAGEVAVVALKNGRCRGCLVTVSANQQKWADQGKLITCDSCGRILCPI
jgi:predicted  nucleic acid-binding Zn-ribbon protein